MKFADEKIYELKEKVRFEMVKNPHISILELQAILSHDYGHRFDKNFIGKLKRKVHRERALRFNSASLNEELAKLEDLIQEARKPLMDIIFDDEHKYKPREIINAIRTVIWADNMLLESMLNAGVFEKTNKSQKKERPLTPEEQDLIKRAIDYANERADRYTRENEQHATN